MEQGCHFSKRLLQFAWRNEKFGSKLYAEEAIGEGIKQIDKITNSELLTERPEIPWQDFIGIRNHIAHGYFDIDGDILFDVVKNNLDSLLTAISYFIDNK